jgi:hypothetical protein
VRSSIAVSYEALRAAAGKTDRAADYQQRARAAEAAFTGPTVSSVERLLARLPG